MADRATNEYLNTERAKNDDNDLFAAIGKQVLGLNLGDDEEPAEDDRVKVVDEIESLCMNCHENGMTRLLLTRIPFFREIILMSFYCEHCHLKNNEIQPAGEIQEQGSKYAFKLSSLDDLERQLVKSDTAILRIEDLLIEVPAGRGRLTNVEGILSEVLKDLEGDQKLRRKEDPKLYKKIDGVVQSLIKMLIGGKFPFTISLDDPAGNSWIEPSPSDSKTKGKYTHSQYPRTPEQNEALGLGETSEEQGVGSAEMVPQLQPEDGGGMEDVDILEGQTYDLPVFCPGCAKPAHMLVQMVHIPHFKQVIVSTTHCDVCGYKTNDVKTGGEVPESGKRIWLHVKDAKDLGRDILKSETCLLKIPECRVEVTPGTMGGRFTTVEGLVTQIRDDLKGSIFDVGEDEVSTDSMPSDTKKEWGTFFAQLDKAVKGEIQYTILMEDPLGNSYCQLLDLDDSGNDPKVRTQEYERTEEEEEELGLADMKTRLNEKGEYVREKLGKTSPKPEGAAESSGIGNTKAQNNGS
ncbi:hypothetical protein HO173_005754 [Letharia columbiana]|uniref:Zinc finger ZPR1-type domain-containing protein n=1 Tax=Letharia columbiana TaxID=112416 RepID=A0A8H6FWJ3_9LECA|nr:uncharacterized protein HO173_005754 [Letharia columbiana]KAF6236126.1 hypothetical protein HO173_005754 [Letharia columbiana]